MSGQDVGMNQIRFSSSWAYMFEAYMAIPDESFWFPDFRCLFRVIDIVFGDIVKLLTSIFALLNDGMFFQEQDMRTSVYLPTAEACLRMKRPSIASKRLGYQAAIKSTFIL